MLNYININPATDNKMILNNFSYYFSLKGQRGGIYSEEFVFIPELGSSSLNNSHSIKSILRNDFTVIETLIDELILRDNNFTIEKIPVFSDSPHSMTAGFEYSGKRKGSAGNFIKTFIFSFSRMFTKLQDRMLEDQEDFFTTISSNLSYSIGKIQTDSCNAKIILKISLGHNLNLLVLNKILNLSILKLSPEAEMEVNNIKKIISMNKTFEPQQLLTLYE